MKIILAWNDSGEMRGFDDIFECSFDELNITDADGENYLVGISEDFHVVATTVHKDNKIYDEETESIPLIDIAEIQVLAQQMKKVTETIKTNLVHKTDNSTDESQNNKETE